WQHGCSMGGGPACRPQACKAHGPLDLIDMGKGLKVQTEKPHLVSLGSGRLSTAITLLPLEEGRTTIGTAATDIILQGPGLVPQHCYIENVRGMLTLHPCGNACAIDGVPLQQPTHLTQGRNRLCFTGAFACGIVLLSIWGSDPAGPPMAAPRERGQSLRPFPRDPRPARARVSLPGEDPRAGRV
uniref:Pleckstrin homology-like domain family B member 1 n=1 Tax=Cyanistes caeruleus TaxID=156563 RepID=A0A8C0UWH3_CYACU